MTIRDLRARGFRVNRNIPGFTGYCGMCRLYRPLDWWESPERVGERSGEVVVCSHCGHVDPRDELFVRQQPKLREAKTA